MSSDPGSPTLGLGTRRAAAALSVTQAFVLGWAATTLPWHSFQVFSAFATLLAAAHVMSAAAALLRPQVFVPVWRAQAWLSLAFLLYLGWVVGTSVSYMVGVYARLGQGLSAALLTAFTPAVLFTLPTSVWALAATGGIRSRPTQILSLIVLFGFVVEVARWSWVGAGTELVKASSVVEFERALYAAAGGPTGTSSVAPAGSLMTEVPAECGPRSASGLRAVLTYRGRATQVPTVRCLDDPDPTTLARRIVGELQVDAADARAKLDLWVGRQSLRSLPPLVAPFVIRPGLDGICGESRCLMPWQLVALNQFRAFQPLDFIKDLQLGIDPVTLRARLGVEDPGSGRSLFSGLERLRTRSLTRDRAGRWHRLERLRPVDPPPLGPKRVRDAKTAASGFVHRAQMPDGRFMYRVDPFLGSVDQGNFSIARQAGTTLALCELGEQGSATERVAARSLHLLSRLLVTSPARRDVGGLAWPPRSRPRYVRLGPSALAAVAYLTCRERFEDPRFDRVIARLGGLLLGLGSDSGRFAPWYDLQNGAALEGPFRLYADGQAVFALILLERLALKEPKALPVAAAEYGAAAERAMRYYSQIYWQIPARDFFFIEENWHCLAARAALSTRRIDSYERFCMDYVRFKARMVFDERRGVRADAVGGYHFSNVTAPFTTPTAGFAEAAAAALTVAERREEDLPKVRAALRRALAFLTRVQWSSVACFACSPRLDMRGAFSESLAAPVVRIDYVQHAWAALGHGARALGMHLSPSEPSG